MRLYNPIEAASQDCASNTITSAYDAIIASTSKACKAILINNSTDVPVTIAIGAASSETDLIDVADGQSAFVPFIQDAGTRIAVNRATANDSTSGYLSITLFG